MGNIRAICIWLGLLVVIILVLARGNYLLDAYELGLEHLDS